MQQSSKQGNRFLQKGTLAGKRVFPRSAIPAKRFAEGEGLGSRTVGILEGGVRLADDSDSRRKGVALGGLSGGFSGTPLRQPATRRPSASPHGPCSPFVRLASRPAQPASPQNRHVRAEKVANVSILRDSRGRGLGLFASFGGMKRGAPPLGKSGIGGKLTVENEKSQQICIQTVTRCEMLHRGVLLS